MNAQQFYKATREMRPESKEYKELEAKFNMSLKAANRASAYRFKLIKRIIDLCEPVRGINVSKLTWLSNDKLIEIGKAARGLNDALNKAELTTGDIEEDKWRD